jgi:sterol 3beta-glucosyltransferase
MKIMLVSIGTRGDMEPFLGVGQILKDRGHQVIAAFPEQFAGLAAEADIEFASLGSEYIESLTGGLAQEAMGAGSSMKKLLANLKLGAYQWSINRDLIRRQQAIIHKHQPERVLYNPKAVYPILWGMNQGQRHILVCPVPYLHFVKDHAHVAFGGDLGPLLNRLTYWLYDFGMMWTGWISSWWLGMEWKIGPAQIKKAIRTNRAIYTISPSLFPRPSYWPDNLRVLGFHARTQPGDWHPGNGLKAFLDSHSGGRIVFITFGSMINPNPQLKTRSIIEALERNNVPAVINTGAGGLVKCDDVNRGLIHFVSEIPYDWIFPRVYAVVHHGGSGTTHMALRHGCATMAVPHVVDQFAWDKIIYELGVGPRGVGIEKIDAGTLEPKILDLVTNESYKERAELLGAQMVKEDYRDRIYTSITDW